MPQKVTAQAVLMCDKGAAPSKLKVTSQQFYEVDGQLVATEQDKGAEVNIPNFGACTVTRGKCVPAPVQWQQTAEKDTINDMKILTEKSTCQCAVGGKISIQHKGFGENHEVA